MITSSTAGIKGMTHTAHYVSAKHGLVGLMRTLANELAPHSIRVNTAHPTGDRWTRVLRNVPPVELDRRPSCWTRTARCGTVPP
ncbi:hypothetical protein PA7_11100 [Pseudonocardia asaccharolytica DSM 44247 = NBRC 16224]|uniref:SDR family oxidoreductase n=1 Tax=Pseudonocardia asaccharolytica DSM 44247 = NBRC 16224 TaxID=1123024 RepID=A0A511CYE6_9PSEU|nr:hypothetical protein PA7_11100 [Pseudonocardia asaccharolytica DSM 44247 = NBRC 16224]